MATSEHIVVALIVIAGLILFGATFAHFKEERLTPPNYDELEEITDNNPTSEVVQLPTKTPKHRFYHQHFPLKEPQRSDLREVEGGWVRPRYANPYQVPSLDKYERTYWPRVGQLGDNYAEEGGLPLAGWNLNLGFGTNKL